MAGELYCLVKSMWTHVKYMCLLNMQVQRYGRNMEMIYYSGLDFWICVHSVIRALVRSEEENWHVVGILICSRDVQRG